jgi:hypothetical protein
MYRSSENLTTFLLIFSVLHQFEFRILNKETVAVRKGNACKRLSYFAAAQIHSSTALFLQ